MKSLSVLLCESAIDCRTASVFDETFERMSFSSSLIADNYPSQQYTNSMRCPTISSTIAAKRRDGDR